MWPSLQWHSVWLRAGYYRLGALVARHDVAVLLAGALATVCALAGLTMLRLNLRVDANWLGPSMRSYHEYEVARQYFQSVAGGGAPHSKWLRMSIEMSPKSGANETLLAVHRARALGTLIAGLQSTPVHAAGDNFTFMDLCGPFCSRNVPAALALSALRQESQDAGDKAVSGKRAHKKHISIEYPYVVTFGRKHRASDSFFGVKLDRNGRMVDVEVLALEFYGVGDDARWDAWMGFARGRIDRFAYEHADLRISMLSPRIVTDAAIDVTMRMLRYLPLSLLLLVAFAVVTSLDFADRCMSMHCEAVIGVFCSLTAVGSAVGLLSWLQVEIVSTVIVMPFLVLAVGVDDVFLILRAAKLDRAEAMKRKQSVASIATAGSDAVADEKHAQFLGRVMATAAPGITASSLTNCLAFAIGRLNPSPEIQLFCTATSFSLFVELLYQLFVFTAVLSVMARRKQSTMTSATTDKIHPIYVRQRHCAIQKNAAEKKGRRDDGGQNAVCSSKPFGLLVTLVVLLYGGVSFYGISQLRTEHAVDTLILDGSPAKHYLTLLHRHVYKSANYFLVVVSSPGDLRRPDTEAEFDRFMAALRARPEVTPRGEGEPAAHWLADYREHMRFFHVPGIPAVEDTRADNATFSYARLPSFMRTAEGAHAAALTQYDERLCLEDTDGCIGRFLVLLRYEHASDWQQRVAYLGAWRAICDAHPSLNATVYDQDALYADMVAMTLPVTRNTVCLTVLALAAVCALFIPSGISVVAALLCAVSIEAGVLGMLKLLFGIDLDPVSMTAYLMTIGFSVDYTAHLSAHFYMHSHDGGGCTAPGARSLSAVRALGPPTVQAACSSLLAVLPLAAVPAQMTRTFVATVGLVTVLGCAHAMLVLPVVLAGGTELAQWAGRGGKEDAIVKSSP